MSTEPATVSGSAPPAVAPAYSRNATGLVREVSLGDMFLMNASSSNPVGIAVAFGIFFALASFPRANILLALVISVILGTFVWLTFALVSATLPRVGGDYLYGSRLLHPVIGLGSNLAAYIGSLMAAGTAAWFMATVAIGPALAIIGVVSGNGWWVEASNTVQDKGWAFVIALVTLAVLSLLSLTGTKKVVRVLVYLYAAAFVSFILSLVILLFTSRNGFIADLNSFSRPLADTPNAYQATIDAGAKAGLTYPGSDGYSVRSTIGALFPLLGFTLFVFWSSTYMSAEMKGAGRRRRQIGAMVGAGIFQGLLVIIAAAIFLKTAGYDFIAAATAGNYPVAVQPFFHFFASVAVGGSDVLAILLGLLFIGWFPVALFAGALNMVQRAPFAWAFDRLIPSKIAAISERTHTPVVSILIAFLGSGIAAAWASFSDNIFTVLTTLTLLLYMPILITGVAALLLPRLHPEVYKDSAADWKIGGIPVIYVAGIGCTLVAVLAIVLVATFSTELGITRKTLTLLLPLFCFVVAGAYYYVARVIQRRRGVDLDLVYQSIPPA